LEVPQAGDQFLVYEDEKQAREVAERRAAERRAEALVAGQSSTKLTDFSQAVSEGGVSKLQVILKADVSGSLGAIQTALLKLNDEVPEGVQLSITYAGTGAVNESDVSLASATNSIIIGFNVRPDVAAKRAADSSGIDIRFYNIIYNLLDDIRAAMAGLLEPTFADTTDGYATVREVFRLPRNEQAAGLIVTDGKILRTDTVRVLRNGAVVHEGPIGALKRFKDDVR
jgi:translation initiation factor IF-2